MRAVQGQEAAIRETRRILKPGGIAVFSEALLHERNFQFDEPRHGWQMWEIGWELLEMLEAEFERVDRIVSSSFDSRYQLVNRIRRDGEPADDYPEGVRVEGDGYMELVAVCHAEGPLS